MIRLPRLAAALVAASLASIAAPAGAALVPNGMGTNAMTLNGAQSGSAAPLALLGVTLPAALDLPR